MDVRKVESFLDVLKMYALAMPNTQLVSADKATMGNISNLFLYVTLAESKD